MKVTSSYAVEVKGIDKHFRTIRKIYQDALSYCIKVFDKEWDRFEDEDDFTQKSIGDSLIHTTKNHKAICDFDTKFPKMPTYMRRAVINNAIGHLKSYHSSIDNWYYDECKGNKPTLQTRLNKLPVFYKEYMYKDDQQGNAVRLKLFVQQLL